jgi:hypothetical protein
MEDKHECQCEQKTFNNQDYDYKKDTLIDENILDKEWLLQSSLTMKWYEYYCFLEKILSKKKKQLRLLEAQIDKFIRSNPGDRKWTESAIKNEIISNDEYQKLEDEIIETQFQCSIAKSAVESMKDRKKALERLCDLWMFGYNSAPKQNIKDNILNSIQDKVKGGLKK